MKLENQVSSLELSKRLKELGVKQESLFWWSKVTPEIEGSEIGEFGCLEIITDGRLNESENICSAFTVGELGEMMPNNYGSRKIIDGIFICGNNKYGISYEETTEANARASMFCFLLEKKWVTP